MGLCAGSRAPSWSRAVVPPLVSSTRGRRGQVAWVLYPVHSTLWAPGCGRGNPRSVPQGSVPRVRRSPWVARLLLPWARGVPARLKAGPSGRLSSPGVSPLGFLLGHVFADRCGDVAFSRAGSKPRQTRDGHSWRMGPLFSFCPWAPRSSSSSATRCRGGVLRGGCGGVCGLRPDSAFPRFSPQGARGCGVQLTQRTLSLAALGSFTRGEPPSLCRGGPSRGRAAHRPGVLSAWRLALCGAPGALQVVSGA